MLIIMSVLGAVVMPHNLFCILKLYRVMNIISKVIPLSVNC